MKQDRSHWTVRKVTFAEAEELDDQYYASLTEIERLKIVMDLRSALPHQLAKIATTVLKWHIHESKKT